jgi:tryptophanase
LLEKAHQNVFLIDAEHCCIDLLTQSHFDYLIEVVEKVWNNRDNIHDYRITYQPKFLRHFTCHFEPIK